MQSLQAEDPERIDGYALVGRLGRGAMGTVYLGRSPGGRLVAVKVVHPGLADDPGFRDRFSHEVATARAVGGFWTAAVVDADPAAPRPWLATEYVPGPTLYEAVSGYGPLPEPALRRLVAGLAEALRAIHRCGLVHRDLKPSNVLLAVDGPRVIDFGIARALEEAHLTATGLVIGTPGFLSPEQIVGRDVTPASDVFALGAVLVYAASGTGPYGSGDVAALVYRAVHMPPQLDGMPSALRPLAARCLDSHPERRPTPDHLLAEVGPPETAEWLPERVRTIVAERMTQAVRLPTRVATRPYTVLSAAPPGAAAPSRPAPSQAGPSQAGPSQAGPSQAGPRTAARPAPPWNHAAPGPLPASPARVPQPSRPQSRSQLPGVRSPGSQSSSESPLSESPPSESPLPRSAGATPPVSPSPPPRSPLGQSAPPPSPAAPLPVSAGPMSSSRPVSRSPAGSGPAYRPPGRTAYEGRPQANGPAVPAAPVAGSRAVFRTSRAAAATWASVTGLGALTCAAISRGASELGDRAGSFVFFVGFLLLALPALRMLVALLRPRHWVEVSAAGIVVGKGTRRRLLPWSQVARVRVVEDRKRPWLVIWPSDPRASRADLGAVYRDRHGGFRVYPIGHERTKAGRRREIRELRAALSWYGRAAYDPSA